MNKPPCPPRPRREGRAAARSSGIVVGRVRFLRQGRLRIPERKIEKHQVDHEVERLRLAIVAARAEIDAEREHLRQAKARDPLMIFEAHRMLIADPDLIEHSSNRIRCQCINAEWALRQELDEIGKTFDRIEDEYLRNRKDDVEQAGTRILLQLLGEHYEPEPQDACSDPSIYVARDFSISDIVTLWKQGAAGFISEMGGADSHNIIVSRGIGMPALVGTADILDDLEEGDLLILDAELGQWICNPGEGEQRSYAEYIDDLALARLELEAYACCPSRSRDGRDLKLMANIEFLDELDIAESIGIDGIGLYRTEHLFFDDSDIPSEEMQYDHYVSLVRRMAGKPVTFRLVDAGGDKQWFYKLLTGHDYVGANPAMGLRGIRLLMRAPELLKTQIRAMLRAGEEGPVSIMVPMVTRASEVALVRALAEECRNELGLTQPASIGAMIEVPAAACIADELAQVSDFFSIGTNDLMQYTLASDRGDDDVASLYQSRHPAVQKLITMAAAAAKEAGIPIAVCGELASQPDWTATFLNLDMDYLSMSLSKILTIRRHLSEQTYRPLL